MKALGTTFAVLIAAGVASAQVGPPTSPGAPPAHGYPGQPFPGTPHTSSEPRHPGEPLFTEPQQSLGETSKATREVRGEVISTDTQARTITIRENGTETDMSTDTGERWNLVLPVDSKAEPSLKKINSGDDVKLVCHTDGSGHQVVDRIERLNTLSPSELPVSQ